MELTIPNGHAGGMSTPSSPGCTEAPVRSARKIEFNNSHVATTKTAVTSPSASFSGGRFHRRACCAGAGALISVNRVSTQQAEQKTQPRNENMPQKPSVGCSNDSVVRGACCKHSVQLLG